MIKKKLLYSILLLLFILTGCKNDNLKVPTLKLTQDGNSIILNWNSSNNPGFKYYRIMRATDGQHYSTINNVDSLTSNAHNKNITTFTDTSFPFVDSIYYKVMVFGDDIISSQNECIHISKPISVPLPISDAYIMPDINKILVLQSNGSNTSMSLYDYTTNALIKTVSLYIESTGSAIFFGKYNGNYEFYFFDSWNDVLNVYDGLTLTKTGSMTFWDSYPMFVSPGNGFIYSNSTSSYMRIINRKSLSMTTYQGSNYIDHLYYMSVNNELLGSYYNKIVLYTLDASGNISTEKSQSYNYSSNLIYIENSNLIYWGNYGSRIIINTETWLEYALNVSNNGYKEFSVLYSKNNVLYACANNESVLYCFSMTDFKLIKTINIRFVPVKFLSDSNYLFFFGPSNGQYIIDKINLVQ